VVERLENGTHRSQLNQSKAKMSLSKCAETIDFEIIYISDSESLSSVSVDECGNEKMKDPTKRSVSSVSEVATALVNLPLGAGGCFIPPNAPMVVDDQMPYVMHDLWKQHGNFCLLFAVLQSFDRVEDAHRLIGCEKPENPVTISKNDLQKFLAWNKFYGFNVEEGANTQTLSCFLRQMHIAGVRTRSESGHCSIGLVPCVERYNFRSKNGMDLHHIFFDDRNFELKKYVLIGYGTSDSAHREQIHDVLMSKFLKDEKVHGQRRKRAGAAKRIRRPGKPGYAHCREFFKAGLEEHCKKNYRIPDCHMSKHAICLVMGRGVPPMLYDPGRNTPTQLFRSYENWREPTSYDIDLAVITFLVSLIFIERFYEVDIKLA
jgi:hypothetical protein